MDFSSGGLPESQARHCARALREAARSGSLAGCEVVLAAETILVEAPPGAGLDELAVQRVLHEARREFSAAASASTIDDAPPPVDLELTTVYDGADLSEAAAALGVSVERLIAAHQAVLWRVQFMGFAPGFGYLIPDPTSTREDAELFSKITRREQSRPSVPAGSVAIAAGYSAVYPRSSPGGWYLIGHTAATMWDSTARPPALLTAGTTVRFATKVDFTAAGAR